MVTQHTEGAFATRAEAAWQRIFVVPFCFMGMGIFRVWTETLYANNQIGFPALSVPFALPVPFVDGYSFFDFVSAFVLVLLAVFARRLAPLCRHPWVIVTCVACMVGSACVNFASLLAPELAALLFWPSVVLGGVGIALILMLWSEFYGCINPLRVALYYSAGIAVSCLILWAFKGLSLWWLFIGACLIPIVSLLCLWRSYATLPRDSYPPAYQGDFSFPWKPVAVIGVYSFVYGLRGGVFAGPLAMNSGVGAFIGAVIVYALVCRQISRGANAQAADGGEGEPAGAAFDFSLLYRIGIPLMFVSLVPLEGPLPWWGFVADTCALASYTVLLILIMAILGNLSYRYGVCALWIFAIERAVRLVTSQSGRIVGNAMQPLEADPLANALLLAAMAGLLVVVAALFLSEKSVSSSQWGVVLKPAARGETREFEQNRLAVKCHELAHQAGLTAREEDILLLVAQGMTLGQISRELYIGSNTVKTHMKHLYQKLDVHSRDEVFALLGVKGETGPTGR